MQLAKMKAFNETVNITPEKHTSVTVIRRPITTRSCILMSPPLQCVGLLLAQNREIIVWFIGDNDDEAG